MNLSDYQLKIDGFIYRSLYMNLMVITSPKPIINIQKSKRKKSKHNTKENHKITREENKRIRNREELQKQPKNN